MELEEPSEVYIKKLLAGNISDVRMQLADAAESIGYDIVEEEPNLIGRYEARGWGAWSGSTNILDYGRTLTIRFKAVSETSTQVTFDYLVKHSMLSKGDKLLVLQEAETIAAISKMQTVEKLCPVCETESTDDSKYCRRCGAPLTSERSELEVLRLMSETRAGKSSVVASTLMITISTIAMLILLAVNSVDLIRPKLFVVLMVFGGITHLLGIVAAFFGWNRLTRALDKPETKTQRVRYQAPETLSGSNVRHLPPQRTRPASVTEGTTNLLDRDFEDERELEKVPVRKKRTTNNLD